MTKENVNKFNKKFIVTALGVAALGFQLMQTNNVKADTAADSKTGDAASEDTVETKDSSVADDSSIQKDTNSTTDIDGTDNADSENNNEQQNGSNDTATKSSNTQNQNDNNSNENNGQIQAASLSTDVNLDNNTNNTQSTNLDEQTTTDDTQQSNVDNNNPTTTDLQANTDPAIIDTNDDETSKGITNLGNDITASLSLSATNTNGTTNSTFSSNDQTKPILNSDSTSTNIILTITNDSNEENDNFGMTIRLPLWSSLGSNPKNIVLSDDFNPEEFLASFPENTTIMYGTEYANSSKKTVEDLESDPSFKWSDVQFIDIASNIWSFGRQPLAYLKANQTITATIPIVQKEKTENLNNGVAFITTNFMNAGSDSKNYDITYGTVSDYKAQSKYTAILSNGTLADEQVQNLMPDYKAGDITINAEGKDVDASDRQLLYGETAKVNLNNIAITSQLNNDGYSYLLNNNGSQISEYTYTPSESNGLMKLTLRQVIAAQDGTTKVGQNWTAADNLTSVQDNDDNVLTGNDAISAVTTTINDQDGILQDGKVVKAGTFEVTYTYNLKDGTAITKTITVTADPATNNSGSSSSSSSSSSNTSSNSSSNNSSSTTDPTDPVVSPDSPDNINDQDRLVSTHPADGVVSLYKLDTTKITNRSLNTASDWYSDKDMTFAGETYYRVATNEWVKASNVYVYQNKSQVIQTSNDQQLVDSKGNTITNRSLLANTAWYTDRIATINGKSYYRVATNEFVPVDAVIVM